MSFLIRYPCLALELIPQDEIGDLIGDRITDLMVTLTSHVFIM